MLIRENKPDEFFRASISMMDDFADFKTYVAEYFSWKGSRHGQVVFYDLEHAEKFLLQLYAEMVPDLSEADQLRISPENTDFPQSH
jgi:hypothetical protein